MITDYFIEKGFKNKGTGQSYWGEPSVVLELDTENYTITSTCTIKGNEITQIPSTDIDFKNKVKVDGFGSINIYKPIGLESATQQIDGYLIMANFSKIFHK